MLTHCWSWGEPVPATSTQNELHFVHVFTVRGCDRHAGRIGSKVALYAEARTGSMGDHMVAANFHANWDPGHSLSIVMPLALDINNDNRDVAWNEWPPVMGLNIVSGGRFHPRSAIRIGAETVTYDNRWRVGIEIEGGAYDTIGLRIGDVIVSRPAAISLRQAGRGNDGIVIYCSEDDDYTGALIRVLDKHGTKEKFVLFASGVMSVNNKAVANVDQLAALERRVARLEGRK